jgi:hypothetical protein
MINKIYWNVEGERRNWLIVEGILKKKELRYTPDQVLCIDPVMPKVMYIVRCKNKIYQMKVLKANHVLRQQLLGSYVSTEITRVCVSGSQWKKLNLFFIFPKET